MTKAVFFDLDGTLADTAPDFAAVLHRLQTEAGLPSTPYPALRTHVSHGIRGMLSIGFGVSPEMDCYPSLAQRFLDYYTEALCVRTQLFEGIADLLHALECQGITWGIVTNKPERLATPLVHALGLSERTACIIGGDPAPRAKPYPDPLLHACRICGISPETSLYVGDDIRDIDAGRAAGMRTLAASYGYLGASTPIDDWRADAIIQHPMQILDYV